MYQLFSYLINQRGEQPVTNETVGILLYPTVEDEYNLDFRYQQHLIKIRTVNLNVSSEMIAKRLLKIIEAI